MKKILAFILYDNDFTILENIYRKLRFSINGKSYTVLHREFTKIEIVDCFTFENEEQAIDYLKSLKK